MSCQNHAKNKLFHMLQKTSCSTCHAKTMQKPCKNHATCGAYAGVYTGQVVRQGGFYAGRRGNPLNITLPGFLAICAICAKMPSSCVSARRAKKQGKKRKPSQTSQKASQEPNQTSQKASQELSQTSQKASQEPSQTSQKASQEPARSQAEPNQPEASQKASRSQAKPARSQPKKARQGFVRGRSALQKRSCWAFCQTAYLGVIILQPHACTQRFRLRILRRTRSNAGRVLEASQVEYKPFGKPPLKREVPGMQGFPAETLH